MTRFRPRLRLVCAALAAWAATSTPLLACPICFQVEDGPTASGIRAAVFVLIGVTVSVLSGFGIFIARFVRRAADQPVGDLDL